MDRDKYYVVEVWIERSMVDEASDPCAFIEDVFQQTAAVFYNKTFQPSANDRRH